ncbi:MAG: hypothetical protein ABR924_03665 [Terracidiphilus sp.]|jgi:hypothetical protein
MADFDAMLNRWQKAGVLDAEAARRTRAFELELIARRRSARNSRSGAIDGRPLDE